MQYLKRTNSLRIGRRLSNKKDPLGGLLYCPICLPKNPAATCASFTSDSPATMVSLGLKKMTEPMPSPSATMGTINPSEWLLVLSKSVVVLPSFS